jgi:glutathione S-transferase
MSSIKLTYFGLAVRADAIRIALSMAGVDFEDIRIDGQKFGELRASGVLPFGQVPILEVDGVVFTQYKAMCRWAATLAGLYPEDALERLKMEEMIEIYTELLYKAPQSADADEKKTLREQYVIDKLSPALAYLNKRIAEYGGPWAIGEKFTLADLTLLTLVNTLKSGILDHLPTDIHEKYDSLVALIARILEHEPVKKYFDAQAK